MYLALELQSLSLYLLASLKKYATLAVEAGLKYSIYGSFASGLSLYGVSLSYGCYGTTTLNSIYLCLYMSSFDGSAVLVTAILGFFFMIAGLLFKLGVAPSHFWVPDVYDGSSTIITYSFALIPKVSILFILYRAFGFFLNPSYVIFFYAPVFLFLISLCALLSLMFGSLGALYQVKFKRSLAFSAVANLGYILLGFGTLSVFGLFASIYYFFIYLVAIYKFFQFY